jgi:hypothetical protein
VIHSQQPGQLRPVLSWVTNLFYNFQHDILSTENDVSLGKLKYVVLVGDENYYLPYFTKIQPINDYGSGDTSTDTIIYSAEGSE